MTGTSQGGTEVIPCSMELRARKDSKTEEADAALISAEEKMLDDEEVASVDDFGNPVADTVKIGNRNLTVAIVRSVVDVGDAPLEQEEGRQQHGDRESQKSDPHFLSTSPGTGEDATTRRRQDEKPEKVIGQALVKTEPDQTLVAAKVEPGGSVPLPTPAPQPAASPPPLAAVPLVQITTLPAPVPKAPQSASLPAPVLSAPQKTSLTALAVPPPQHPPRLPVVVVKPPVASASRVSSRPPVHISHGVPNPLANLATPVKQEPSQIARPAVAAVPKPVVRPSYQSAVPCPLPSVFCPPPASIPPPILTKVHHAPSPLPAPVLSIPVVTAVATVSMDLLPTKRGRIFSMDIDPDGLDFPDMSVDIGSGFCPSPALPPLAAMGSNHSHQFSPAIGNHSHSYQLPHPGAPMRAVPVPLPAHSDPVMGRDRAMSFEFFSLGINADEPLPPPPDMTLSNFGTFMRPRGDSIIFDPASFQDGGIHEEKAFFRSRTNSIDLPSKDEMAIMNAPGFAAPTVPVTNQVTHKPMAPTPYRPQQTTSAHQKHQSQNSAQMATLPSSLNTSMNHATFQMDLLNKDGRIGIYLPDARKARIAKFHSKRKMRIWRKRIKYDCRKKLADSRPRIKGRFVKRSDMDD